MEIVIPPRDHGPSTFRYTWDENGEVQQMTRVRDDLPADRRVQRGRQTVQWPFQSVSTDPEVPATPTATWVYGGRPVTWEPKRSADRTSLVDDDIIPDYVRNYIRGETPESVARRKRNGGKLGERGVDIAHQHRPHQSRVADFEGFRELGRTPSQMGESAQGDDEMRFILSGGSREKDGGWRGWRGRVAGSGVLALVMLAVAVVGLVFGIARGVDGGGQAVLWEGECGRVATVSWGLHAVISVMVVVTVAGANYVFKVLSSPTREEVQLAHTKGKRLDIGVPSFRNLAHIDARRTAMTVVILLAAALTQAIYNGATVTSLSTSPLTLVLATPSFLTGAQFSNDTSTNFARLSRLDILSLQQAATRPGILTNLTAPACLSQLTGLFSPSFSAALFITNTTSPTPSSILGTSTPLTPALDLSQTPLLYCLALPLPSPPTCSLLLNAPLLGAVAVLHLLALLTATALLVIRFSPDTTTTATSPKPEVSPRRWAVTFLLWLAPTTLAGVGLAHSLLADPAARLSPFGTASPFGMVRLPEGTGPAGAGLVGSVPHVLLFGLYFAVDGVLGGYRRRVMGWVVGAVFVGLEFLVGMGWVEVAVVMGGERGEFVGVSGEGMLGVLAGLVGVGIGVAGWGVVRGLRGL